MKKLISLFILLALNQFVFQCNGNAQAAGDSATSVIKGTSQEKNLFDSDEILDITLKGRINELLSDRFDEQPKDHPFLLEYRKADSTIVSITVEARTRGHFRRLKENCYYPPILLSFSKGDTLNSSIFKEQTKLKLGMPCQGDQYIIHEWLVYKLYNLLTPKSFRARLVRVRLEDSKNQKQSPLFYGMLLEDEKQMARRNGAVTIKAKLRPEQTEANSFLTMAVFEYMIGNTDWSIQFLQNIKLIAPDSNTAPTAVPYDFDMSGLVNTPYAKPAEELQMRSVRQRRYRGYCITDMKKFDETFALFNRLKKDIYATFTNCSLLDAKYINATIKFLDEFYDTINNPAALAKEFGYPCDKNGTGNVVIKGLREE